MRPITLSAIALMAAFHLFTSQPLQAKTIFVAPSGIGDGSDEAHPAGNISNAASSLNPGDTLIFLDGVYHQTLSINGLSGSKQKPVVLMARNPGKVVIDADTVRTNAVYINNVNYLKVDGIEGGNSLHHAWNLLNSSYVTLSRCAGFNAGFLQGTDGHAVVTYEDNCHVFSIAYSDHILSEDMWGWGTGRYVFVYFQCSYSTIRRGVFRADNYDRAPHAG
ncbi:MAG TPA: chondroitinase-B domain-containing protein, partial [Bacteroidales bacterium]|nr:chondroitinase-B domain-containing protein [Bacteroidales bacterium]